MTRRPGWSTGCRSAPTAGAAPKVLPFQVRDADGATAAASVYIPPTGDGLPYVLPGSLIELDSGESTTGKVTDYIAAPDGRPGAPRVRPPLLLRLARPRSPSGPTATTGSRCRPRRPSAGRARCSSRSRPPPTPAATRTPRRPRTASPRSSRSRWCRATTSRRSSAPPTSSRCRPASATTSTSRPTARSSPSTPATPPDLDFSAEWSQAVDGVDVGSPRGLRRAPSPRPTPPREGGEAVLSVRAGESNPQEVRFRLAQAPPPRLTPIRVETMEAGQTRTYDMARLPRRPASPTPIPRSCTVQNTGIARREGERRRQPAHADRRRATRRGAEASFRLVVSDVVRRRPAVVAHGRGPDRSSRSSARPRRPASRGPTRCPTRSAPSRWGGRRPTTTAEHRSSYYMVREEKSGAKQRCDTNECVFRKLKTGGNYSFRVQAFNRVGGSDWSNLSRSAQRRHAARPGAGHPDDRPRRRPDHHRLGQAIRPTPRGSSTTPSPGRAAAPSSSPAAPRPSPSRAWTTTRQYIFTIKAQNAGRLLAAPDVRGDAAPRHAAGARGARR